MSQPVALILAFVLIIVLINRKVPLPLAMLAGSATLGLGLGLGPLRTLQVMGRGMLSPASLELVVVVALITILGRLMQEFGLLQQTIDALTGALRSTRLALVAAPTMVGLLPVIGGAIISAPIVDGLGDRLELPPAVKAAVNLVFRHAWFFVFPFNTTLILAAQLADMPLGQLIRMQWPLSLVAVVVGYLVYFRGRPREQFAAGGPTRGALTLAFLVMGSPLLIGLVLSVAFGLHMAPALAIGIALAFYLGRRHPSAHPRLLWLGIDRWMVLTMPSIVAFREVVGEAGVMAVMVSTLVQGGMPLLALAFFLPLVVGFIGASNSTTIGITFPLLLPLAEPAVRPVLVMLMFTSSFVAYLVSPLHLCQILTLDYFRLRLGSIYGGYLLPMGATLLAVWGLAWLYLR
ncbi:MAG: DUF401 family protein [bacterium]|nr:DUF401 family protein [bacterium]